LCAFRKTKLRKQEGVRGFSDLSRYKGKRS
jgi:hypothetical protein